jgi:hypothetical protein
VDAGTLNHQAPTSKLQKNSNRQNPEQEQIVLFPILELGVSLEFGAWNLEFCQAPIFPEQ